mmetsp:Transcript_25522/g.35928  ORF Transcript_25522/g.35928 Transcript_25522/m.35928 type:complete len:91 (+) Transcript_25522:1466-1738(+)
MPMMMHYQVWKKQHICLVTPFNHLKSADNVLVMEPLQKLTEDYSTHEYRSLYFFQQRKGAYLKINPAPAPYIHYHTSSHHATPSLSTSSS